MSYRKRLMFAVFFSALTIAIGWLTVTQVYAGLTARQSTMGTITHKITNYHSNTGANTCSTYIQYVVNGKTYETVAYYDGICTGTVRWAGSKIKVRYNEKKPEVASVRAFGNMSTSDIVFTAIGGPIIAICALVYLLATFKYPPPKNQKKKPYKK